MTKRINKAAFALYTSKYQVLISAKNNQAIACGYCKMASNKLGRYTVVSLFLLCVRRAFLCGEERFSRKSYERRKGWVEDKLLAALAKIFCIDVVAYAVMSNHTHLVLYVDDEKANRLNNKAIIIRWHPWRLPVGPAKAFKVVPYNFVGRSLYIKSIIR